MSAALARPFVPAPGADPEPLKTRILLALAIFQDGATTHQLADYLRESLGSITPRMPSLVKSGKVADSNIRDNGRTVWRLVPCSN